MKLPGTETQRKWASRVAIVVAIGIAYYLFTQVLDLESLLEKVAYALGAWTYALVGFFAFAETGAFIGLVAPGETVMLLGGAIAGQGAINLYVTIALAWTMACAGDVTSFFLGRRLGREFLLKHGPRFGFSHERLHQVEDFFSRHGGKTIFLGRFVGFVRAFAPFIAGSSGMRFRQFFPYSVLGCGIWVSATVVIGYVFSRSIDTAINYAGKGAVLLGALIVIVVGVVWATRFLREPENRRAAVRWMDEHAATRWITALARRYETELRFVADRLTPGGTFGLEFTSLMAVLAVALFVLIAYIVVIEGNPGPTPGDETATAVAEAIHCGFMTGFSKFFTFLGSGGFVWTLTLACAAALAWARRWTEVCVLLAGMALTVLGFHEIKAAVDRPRPEGGLVGTTGSSFPSGHAAQSVIYVWLATTIVVRLRPGMTRGTLVVVAGIAVTALVGLSRVYLNVHYLSDVSSGWALGAACFSICAAIGLVVAQLRHNPLQ
ncbi:MAG TPA: bifunctional DedA family/phosphatase PAP2 family protein [Solirubrobacterales bacterium]|jgi:undecaprenyl-diphosphatase|nr:bifunctional DedA family/phosphatase PAP2 family protein [Solirubrobacterales bacterium]